MKTFFHKSLTSDLWNAKATDFQILSIGAELGRAKNHIKNKNIPEVKNSLARALELIDLTVEDPKWGKKFREFLRFREMTAQLYANEPENLGLCLGLYRVLLQMNPLTAELIVD